MSRRAGSGSPRFSDTGARGHVWFWNPFRGCVERTTSWKISADRRCVWPGTQKRSHAQIGDGRHHCPLKRKRDLYSSRCSGEGTLFFPLGGAIAIFHPERYVSVISGLDTSRIIQSAGTNQSATPRELIVRKGIVSQGEVGPACILRMFLAFASSMLKICAGSTRFFSALGFVTKTPPVIRAARLMKSGDAALIDISGVAAKDTRITCTQGNYRIYIDAFDTIISGSPLYSAPYRFLVLLDGESVVDSSFATAKCTEDGLSFLGNAGSSREAVTADGLYSVGTIALVRGEHDLQLLVSDYAGNTSMLKASIIVR